MPQTTSYRTSSASSSDTSKDRSSSSSSCNSPLTKQPQTTTDSTLRNQLKDFNISTPPSRKRLARSINEKNDDTDNDIDEDTVSGSRSSRKSLFTADKICKGYDPEIISFFLNFPFQVFDLYHDLVNFVVSNNKLHSKSCAANFFLLVEKNIDQINKTCSNLQYDTFLQGM